MVRGSGAPRYVMNVLNAIPEYAFIAMIYISAKRVLLDNTWEYLFPSKEFVWLFIVSDYHVPSNHFFYNILYARYLSDNGITENHISC